MPFNIRARGNGVSFDKMIKLFGIDDEVDKTLMDNNEGKTEIKHEENVEYYINDHASICILFSFYS